MLTLRFGTGESLRGKIGAVELMGWLMSKGTLRLGNQELQDELTRLRAQLSLNSTLGLVQMTVKTKRKFVPEVIKLVGEVLREPRFDEDELEVIRSQVISSLQQEASNPQSLSPRAVRKKLAPYEKGDVRCVQSIDEEIAMYEKVTVEEIQQLHSNFLSSQAGEITGVGDFDAEEVKQLWKEQLQGWKTEQPTFVLVVIRIPKLQVRLRTSKHQTRPMRCSTAASNMRWRTQTRHTLHWFWATLFLAADRSAAVWPIESVSKKVCLTGFAVESHHVRKTNEWIFISTRSQIRLTRIA